MASKKQRTEGTEDDVAMQEEINDFRVNTTFATVSFTISNLTDFLTGTIVYYGPKLTNTRPLPA